MIPISSVSRAWGYGLACQGFRAHGFSVGLLVSSHGAVSGLRQLHPELEGHSRARRGLAGGLGAQRFGLLCGPPKVRRLRLGFRV